MKIGIDIDEVLASLLEQLTTFYNQRFGASFSLDDYQSYDLRKIWGGDHERAVRIVGDFYKSLYFDRIIPTDHSQDAVEKISKRNRLIAITSRPDFIQEKTEDWIEKYFPQQFEEIICTGRYVLAEGRGLKSDICLRKDVEVIIEDNLQTCLDCASQGIRAILLDKPWNQNGLYDDGRIVRVKNWSEILEKINEMNYRDRK